MMDKLKALEVMNNVLLRLDNDGHRLLYFVTFGSHLYGTGGHNSDLDFKFLFLPNKRDMLLGNYVKHYNYSTGDNTSKNSAGDVDVNGWSLQYWLELVNKGETNALDLLYSFTNKSMIHHKHFRMDCLFDNHDKLFNVSDCNSYVGYAIGQARKYGIKGSRLGVIKKVYEGLTHNAFTNVDDDWDYMPLSIIVKYIIRSCGDESYCFIKDLRSSNGSVKPYLVLCGAKHELSITVGEFYERVRSAYEKYGERAKKAEQNEGVDFKALSHALRAIDQMRMLLVDGMIKYPLPSAVKLREVKEGKYSWKEVESMILDGIEMIDKMMEDRVGNYDKNFVDDFVLDMYSGR